MEETSGCKFRATSEQWEGIREGFIASGKSIRGYCREKKIPVSQMSYHLRRMRKAQGASGFIELVREVSPGSLWIEAGRCKICVERGFDAELLRQVAEALS